MKFRPTELASVIEVLPNRFADSRGYFSETFRQDLFDREIGEENFVQENESLSRAIGTIRGLHFQKPPAAQAKLVRCTGGAIFDVAVDLRADSPDFGRWVGVTLSEERGNQLWIPAGFAHGFCTLTPDARVSYKVTAFYSPRHDSGVACDDPDIAIDWPDLADRSTLSAKDFELPRLADLPTLFRIQDRTCAL
nr:dTDP-4-dehydrorhamnose 3,5-epimerase [Novosphingobium sp.]